MKNNRDGTIENSTDQANKANKSKQILNDIFEIHQPQFLLDKNVCDHDTTNDRDKDDCY